MLDSEKNLDYTEDSGISFVHLEGKATGNMSSLLTSALLVLFGSFQGSSQTGTSGRVRGSEGGKPHCTQRLVGTARSDSTHSLKTE